MLELANLSVRVKPGYFFVSWGQPHHIDFDYVEVAWWCPVLQSLGSQRVYGTTCYFDVSEALPGTLYVVAARMVFFEQFEPGPWEFEVVKTISSSAQTETPKDIVGNIRLQLDKLQAALT